MTIKIEQQITLNIKGQKISLTRDELSQLKDEIEKVYSKDKITSPWPQPIPDLQPKSPKTIADWKWRPGQFWYKNETWNINPVDDTPVNIEYSSF